jgi:hypothetical protein
MVKRKEQREADHEGPRKQPKDKAPFAPEDGICGQHEKKTAGGKKQKDKNQQEHPGGGHVHVLMPVPRQQVIGGAYQRKNEKVQICFPRRRVHEQYQVQQRQDEKYTCFDVV